MHVIAIRRDVYEANRWNAMSLYEAFVEAQRICYERAVRDGGAAQYAAVDDRRDRMAEARNGRRLVAVRLRAQQARADTFLRYHFEQGLSKRRVQPEELFVPETMAAFKI